jgi:hypothetical protein
MSTMRRGSMLAALLLAFALPWSAGRAEGATNATTAVALPGNSEEALSASVRQALGDDAASLLGGAPLLAAAPAASTTGSSSTIASVTASTASLLGEGSFQLAHA